MAPIDTASPSKRPTIRDVAARSGVSRATVSYVLNKSPNQTIPEATRQRVIEAAVALGYAPSAAAVTLRRGHSNIVLIVKDAALSGYVTEPFLAAISERIKEAGYSALMTDYLPAPSLERLVRELRPYGLLSLTSVPREEVQALEGLGVHRTRFSLGSDESRGNADIARPWESRIGALQAEHLLDRGAASIVFALPGEDSPREVIARERAKGAADIVQARRGETLNVLRIPSDRVQAAQAMASLTSLPAPIGLCCFDDTVAGAALAGGVDIGARIPEDVMLIGVDDSPFASLVTPPLSSIRIDARTEGRRLAERLLGVDPGANPQEENLHVIARQSSIGPGRR